MLLARTSPPAKTNLSWSVGLELQRGFQGPAVTGVDVFSNFMSMVVDLITALDINLGRSLGDCDRTNQDKIRCLSTGAKHYENRSSQTRRHGCLLQNC